MAACLAMTVPVTVYDVVDQNGPSVAAPSPSISVTAIGTAVGATTYVKQAVQSVVVEAEGNGSGATTTKTLTTTPHTVLATFVEGATHVSFPPLPKAGIIDKQCDFNGKGGAVCVEVLEEVEIPGGTVTTTETWTGSAVPIYTLQAEQAEATSTKNNGAGSASVRGAGGAWGVVAVGVLWGALWALA
ncbi:hypothetical protein DXG01_014093 [Tephrocybe rancida]|nr:hypothetical protein DXG01_014093 [Tephrocybe rancida]